MNQILWMKVGEKLYEHFPGIVITEGWEVYCEMCEEMKDGRCQGKQLKNQAVIECMLEKVKGYCKSY
jgi:hypothetical protein